MSKLKIFIVEDETIVTIDLKRNLEQLGHSVVAICTSGEEALQKADRLEFDILLMDVTLNGELDGFETARLVNEKIDVPIIFLTAYSYENNIEKLNNISSYGYLIKPFDYKDLRINIELAYKNWNSEKRVKEYKNILNTTINSLQDGVIRVDSNGIIIFANKSIAGILGTTSESLVGLPIESVYKTRRELMVDQLITSFEKDKEKYLNESIKLKVLDLENGHCLPIEEEQYETYDERGKTNGKVFLVRDLTERIKTNTEIMASRNFYMTILEDFPAMIWKMNEQGEYTYFNKTWLDFKGKGIDEELYQGWKKDIHHNDIDKFESEFANAVVKKSKLEAEFRMKDCMGAFRWILCIASPLYNYENKFQGYIGVNFDISKRKSMELELLHSKDKAEMASRAKSEFISNISHELRTPMNGIIGLIDIIMDMELDRDIKKYMSLMNNSAFDLLKKINNLIDIAKLDIGKGDFFTEEFSLETLVANTCEKYNPDLKQKGIELICDVTDNVPQKVIGPKERLRQVLENLIENSMKFTNSGYIKVRLELVKISQENAGNFILSVEDTGIGIKDEKLSLIFDRFTQGDWSLTKKYEGAGMGLSIVKQIIEKMSGDIRVESKVNEGTKFIINFFLRY